MFGFEKKEPAIAFVGGSIPCDLKMDKVKEYYFQTPFGLVPDPIVEGYIGKKRVLLASKHGKGHVLLPHEIPSAAIIFMLKFLGAKKIVFLSAVGIWDLKITPKDVILTSSYDDRTYGRSPNTFFGGGIVGHIRFANVRCDDLVQDACIVLDDLGLPYHREGGLRVISGPRYSNKLEAKDGQESGIVTVGMTQFPIAPLAKEAECCIIEVTFGTDYCCLPGQKEVCTTDVVEVCVQNAKNAIRIIKGLVEQVDLTEGCACHKWLDNAVITNADFISRNRLLLMEPIFGRVLNHLY